MSSEVNKAVITVQTRKETRLVFSWVDLKDDHALIAQYNVKDIWMFSASDYACRATKTYYTRSKAKEVTILNLIGDYTDHREECHNIPWHRGQYP